MTSGRGRSQCARPAGLVALLAAAVAVAGCGGAVGGDDGGSKGGDGAGGPKIGYTATLTGEFASYGRDMRQGIDLAVKELNGKGGIGGPITLTAADDQGKPANGPVVAQKLCDGDADVILGYSFSSVALAAVPVFDSCKIPVVASAVTSPELSGSSSFFHRDTYTDAYQGAQMGQYAATKLGRKRIAVLFQQDDYGTGVAKAFADAATKSGATITSKQGYQLGTKDFNTLIARLKKDSPDAIFIGGFYAEVAKIAQQARAAGVDVQLLGTDGAVSSDLPKLGGKSVEGMLVYGSFSPASKEPVVADFVKRYKAAYGNEPSSFAALAYDAVHVVKAAADAGGGSDRAQLTAGLGKMAPYTGVTGKIAFDDKGDRTGEVVFLKLQGGEFVDVR